MSNSPQLYYSGVKSALKRAVLYRGLAFTLAGIGLWVAVGAFASQAFLATWGLAAFAVGAGLIAFGLTPYRQLHHLEAHPHRLLVIPNDSLHFLHKGKPFCTVPLAGIQRLEYRENPSLYGIALWLRNGADTTGLLFYRPRTHPGQYVAEVQRRHKCDLFLPYFAKPTYTQLADLLDEPS